MIRNYRLEDEGKSLLERMNETFLFGHTVRFNGWTIRAPIWLPPILYSLCTIGTIAKMFSNYSDLGLVIENFHMVIHMVIGTQTSLIAMKNKKVVRLSQLLDVFEEVPGFEKESRTIKIDCENNIQAIYSTYSRCLLVSTSVYILFPLGKLFGESDGLRLDDLLVWPMRVGFLEEHWWGFALIFGLEMITCVFLVLSVIFTVSYLVCLGKMTVGHCDNLCLALRTLKTKSNQISKIEPSLYDDFVCVEIDKCARQLDSIQK